MVSEIMLQQTQVDRVIPKYKEFLKAFPNVVSLAKASTSDVLSHWSGLGYNRRALFLKRTAEIIVKDFKGKFPKDPETLETLPGIGHYTARAIATFSFGGTYTFIETNIRSVYIHEFMPKALSVSDMDLIPYVETSLSKVRPREWYFALMDYGSFLKKTQRNPNRKSKHHTKQSKFEGSLRQIRGTLLKKLVDGKKHKKSELLALYKKDLDKAQNALQGLISEGFIQEKSNYIKIIN